MEATIARALKRASEYSRPKPAGATCLYYLEADDELVHQGCACRGGAGWVHVECAFEGLAANLDVLHHCSLCRQGIRGTFRVRLSAAHWRFHRRAPGGTGVVECDHLLNALDAPSTCFSPFDEVDAALTISLQGYYDTHRRFPAAHHASLVSVSRVGDLLLASKRYREARNVLEPSSYLWRTATARDPDCALKLDILEGYIRAIMNLGHVAQAEPLVRQGLVASRRYLGEDAGVTIRYLEAAVGTHIFQRRLPQAREAASLARDGALRVFGPDHNATRRATALAAHLDVMSMMSPA